MKPSERKKPAGDVSDQPDSDRSHVRLSEANASDRPFTDCVRTIPPGGDAAAGTGAPLGGALATMNVGG
jgi:hypothetical protein